MQPFWDLVKTKKKLLEYYTGQTLQWFKIKIQEGIKIFDINKHTCLQTDWSKEGVGYLLLQQHCSCPCTSAQTCCLEGWHLVFTGSWFTTHADSQYAPTYGECLAISWSLNSACRFILGCKELIVVTDHKPLLGILNSTEIYSIPNPRLQSLKEKTLQYEFSIQYCPGKWQQGVVLYIHAMIEYLSWTLFVQTHQIMTAQSLSIKADLNYSSTKNFISW